MNPGAAGADADACACTLRPITPADAEFLYRVYASTRLEELAVAPWTDAQKEAFLRQQFAAQHAYYQQMFAGAQFSVLRADSEDIGRLYVSRTPEEIRIIDIALLPAWRNRGLGGALLRGLIAEAEAARQRVSIHVEKNNPALRLYQRLGFKPVADRGVYWLMECGTASAT